jgi:hypothetical protein
MGSLTETQSWCSGEPLLVPGALRGYRTWETMARHPDSQSAIGLYALTGPAWEVETEAFCRKLDVVCNCKPCTENALQRQDHPSPDGRCTCGIYGYYSPEFITHNEFPIIVGFFGVIEASGKVLLGTKGFRAQRARIVAVAPWASPTEGNILFQADLDRTAKRIKEDTNIAVFPTFDNLLDAYPPEDFESLIENVREN